MSKEFPRRPEFMRRPRGERPRPSTAEPRTQPDEAPLRDLPAGRDAPVRRDAPARRDDAAQDKPPGLRRPARENPSDDRAPSDRPAGRAPVGEAGGRFVPRGAATERGGNPRKIAAATAWEAQAGWYDRHQKSGGDDFYQELILPAVSRQLQVEKGARILDVACGQGVVGRHLAESGIHTLGVDASPSLIDAANRRATATEKYLVGDATALVPLLSKELGKERLDGATAVLAMQDLDPLEPVLHGIASVLKPGARLVIVLTHPCFRIPKHSGWGFDEETDVQYRRIENYLSPQRLPIITHPGRPASESQTWSFHRPLSTYINGLGGSGFGVVGIEELCSHRRGSQGRRSAAEDRALSEIPLFLVITGLRLS